MTQMLVLTNFAASLFSGRALHVSMVNSVQKHPLKEFDWKKHMNADLSSSESLQLTLPTVLNIYSRTKSSIN